MFTPTLKNPPCTPSGQGGTSCPVEGISLLPLLLGLSQNSVGSSTSALSPVSALRLRAVPYRPRGP